MSAENRPNNHKLIRILTAAGILGGTGAVVVGKVMLDELSKAKPAASAEFVPSPTPAVIINGERYVVSPTATTVFAPKETATLPPSPTATKKTAPTATRTATTTAVSRILVPQSEKVFETGMVERYGMITEQNFDRFFARIPENELQKLTEEQPDLILFPFVPLSEKFSFGETESRSSQRNIHIEVYSPHILLIAGINGKLEFSKAGGNYSGLYIVQDLSEKVSVRFQNTVLGRNPRFKPIIDAPIWKSVDSRGKDVTKGVVLAEFFGSDAFDNGKYSGAENQIGFNITKLEKLDAPVKVGPGNLTMTAKTTYLTPSFSNPDLWVHTKDGRIAIPKLQ